jgi:hypothetical protein
VADRRKAHVETACDLFEAQALAGSKVEPADLFAKDAIHAVFDGRDLEWRGALVSHP